MGKVIRFLLLTVLMLPGVYCFSQTYYFRHYEVESGLSNNAVVCSGQDLNGFMWFGTRDGLNRFDGASFKVYRFPGSTLVRTLFIDASGTLLVGTERDVYKYNARLDSFAHVLSTNFFGIDKIVRSPRGVIWFVAGNVLSSYSEITGKTTVFSPENYFWAKSITVDRRGTLWVATADGFLKRFNDASGSFYGYNVFSHSKPSPWSIYNIECSETDKILIGTNKAGFKIFDTQALTYRDIQLGSSKLDNLFIRCFLRVSATEWWIGTETGIYSYKTLTGHSTLIEKNSSDQYALSDNVIYTLAKDKEGGIWVGSYFGGINYYPKQNTPFRKYYQQSSKTPLSGNIIREINQDQFGNLWIGAEDGGVNKLDAATGRLVYYKPDNTGQSIPYISVHSLLPDGNKLWVGTYEHGLNLMDIKSGKVIRHYSDKETYGFKSKIPFCFLKTHNGKIIVGCTNGIFAYNKNNEHFDPVAGFNINDFYNYLFEDTMGTIWASIPGKGTSFVNPQTGTSGNYMFNSTDSTSISNDKVNCIFEDSEKNLWFTTENGLCQLDRNTGKFRRFGTQNGFPSNFMLSMLEDKHRNLWISTTKGLACFSLESHKISVFTTANGLLSDQFNFSSAFKDKSNRMYFGSAKGLVSFDPSTFIRDNYSPAVFFTGLQIDNQEARINAKDSPLSQSISHTKNITLNHNQSTFSITFAILGYTAPQNLQFEYKLDGLDPTWTVLKGGRKLNFTKLPTGKYLLKIRGSSTNGTWNKQVTKLEITILPPWWKSNFAFLIYTLSVLLLIYLFMYYYHKRIEAKNKRKIELLEIAKEKEILQAEITREKQMLETKIEFFTQVAHEIKTPLTLIKIPLGKVIRKTAGMTEIENSLKIISGNTNRLIELSSQLLDFRQTELKAFRLTVQTVNISDLLTDAIANFMNLAEQNNISLTVDIPAEPLHADVDVDAFTKIIYNLFSNAVKYADQSVVIALKKDHYNKNTFTILVENDGYLIPAELNKKIFEPFFRIKETESKTGSGIGLALALSLAQIHGGTLTLENQVSNFNVFSLTLPVDNDEANNPIS